MSMWVIKTEDGNCVIKGKSIRCLVGVEEETKKELVTYGSRQRAQSAIMRMMPLQSGYVMQLYKGQGYPRLVPHEDDIPSVQA